MALPPTHFVFTAFIIGLFVQWKEKIFHSNQHREEKMQWLILILFCGLIGAAPDLDYLGMFLGFDRSACHRTFSHSVIFQQVVVSFLLFFYYYFKRMIDFKSFFFLVQFAYFSHLFLDLFSSDHHPPKGIRLLWPLSKKYYAFGFGIFPEWRFSDLNHLKLLIVKLVYENLILLLVLVSVLIFSFLFSKYFDKIKQSNSI